VAAKDDVCPSALRNQLRRSSETVYHPRQCRWSEVAERVAATTRTSEKTAVLADYSPDSPSELPIVPSS
jgi:hypothetical protein